jgi:hypothetical protein
MKTNPQIEPTKTFDYVIYDEVYRHEITATDPCSAVWELLGTDLKKYDMGDMAMGEKCELRVMEKEEGEHQDCGTLVLESNGSGRVLDWEWKLI